MIPCLVGEPHRWRIRHEVWHSLVALIKHIHAYFCEQRDALRPATRRLVNVDMAGELRVRTGDTPSIARELVAHSFVSVNVLQIEPFQFNVLLNRAPGVQDAHQQTTPGSHACTRLKSLRPNPALSTLRAS